MKSVIPIFIFILILNSTIFPGVVRPKIVSYKINAEFYPEHMTDYAGFIEILRGVRPPWNKEDSVKNYPYMKAEAVMTIDLGNDPSIDDELKFYIHGELRAHKVFLDSIEVKFKEEREFYSSEYSMIADMISVPADGKKGIHKVEIVYGGMFNPSYAGSPSNYMRIDREGAYLRGFGYSLWFPTLFKPGEDVSPASFNRVAIKTKEKFSGVFTGTRLTEKIENGFRTSIWKAEYIDPWHAQITVRPFKTKIDHDVFLYYLDHPESERSSEDMMKFVRDLLTRYSDNYKPIRNSPQIHIVEMPNFASGISSGNMIGMTSGQWRRFSLTDKDINMELLVSHELVHKFVQPQISIKSPLAALFIEGFPSYFHIHTLSGFIGEKWYQDYMKLIEKYYLQRKKTGLSYRGKKLPVEKPILSITFDEIGKYKDTFILNDRVRLFLNFLRSKKDKKTFRQFTRELCESRDLTVPEFKKLIIKHFPSIGKDIDIWLITNDYPERFKLKKYKKSSFPLN